MSIMVQRIFKYLTFINLNVIYLYCLIICIMNYDVSIKINR